MQKSDIGEVLVPSTYFSIVTISLESLISTFFQVFTSINRASGTEATSSLNVSETRLCTKSVWCRSNIVHHTRPCGSMRACMNFSIVCMMMMMMMITSWSSIIRMILPPLQNAVCYLADFLRILVYIRCGFLSTWSFDRNAFQVLNQVLLMIMTTIVVVSCHVEGGGGFCPIQRSLTRVISHQRDYSKA